MENKCILCDSGAERHHIRTRGSGGSDHDCNIMYLCREHHVEIHKIGINTFIRKNNLNGYMELKGWDYFEVLKKWLPPKRALRSYEKT